MLAMAVRGGKQKPSRCTRLGANAAAAAAELTKAGASTAEGRKWGNGHGGGTGRDCLHDDVTQHLGDRGKFKPSLHCRFQIS